MDYQTQEKSKSDPLSFLTLDKLVVKPPITSNAVSNFDPEVIAKDAKSTRIIVQEGFLAFVEKFLDHKRKHGSKYEKQLYAQPFNARDEVTRLIEKRPLVFMGANDYTILRDGREITDRSRDEWDRNGKDNQHLNKFLTLDEYLSYDEIMLSSLIGVSGPSYFINDGNRYNQGEPGRPGTFRQRGIIIGLVGARFERPGRMDSIHTLNHQPQYEHPELTELWTKYLYRGYAKIDGAFNHHRYHSRIRHTAANLLQEASDRAGEAHTKAYVYVVGLGLGVWQHNKSQQYNYVNAFMGVVNYTVLRNIGTIDFAWIDVDSEEQKHVLNGEIRNGIKITFSKRNPAELVPVENQLLVVSYAWDGNAFPGNEYWCGSLSGSGVSNLESPFVHQQN